MKILAVETSCDETSATVVEGKKNLSKVILLSNVVSSSLSLHSETGGIIPEIAAREQVRYILPVINEALEKANVGKEEIDAIAVTQGPGLIGSLLVGMETAKTLSYVWEKPLFTVNHLIGHIYANFIGGDKSEIKFPAIVLIVSGGHTDLLLMTAHRKIKWLGGTRDDAAGEAFDKIARLLSLPYPGGPSIEKAAREGNEKAIPFPRPMIGSDDFDFSFSGLKTAVLLQVKETKKIDKKIVADLSASAQKAIIDVLISKTLKAERKFQAKSILLSGGVAANQRLREEFKKRTETLKIDLFVPPKNFCTDNAAMIGAAAFFDPKKTDWRKADANPELYFD